MKKYKVLSATILLAVLIGVVVCRQMPLLVSFVASPVFAVEAQSVQQACPSDDGGLLQESDQVKSNIHRVKMIACGSLLGQPEIGMDYEFECKLYSTYVCSECERLFDREYVGIRTLYYCPQSGYYNPQTGIWGVGPVDE